MKNEHWYKELKNITPFKKYSQYGEEGYLKFILENIGETNRYLVDIGAGGYGAGISNSRYFFENGWDGLAFDMNDSEDKRIVKAFIKPDNIVKLLSDNNCPKEFDFLNVDLDSFDYDIIDNVLSNYSPRIVFAEFNGTLNPNIPVKLAYEDGYTWDSTNKYGFSFSAGLLLFSKHKYSVVFNHVNTNMFAIRRDLLPEIVEVSLEAKQIGYHATNINAQWVLLG